MWDALDDFYWTYQSLIHAIGVNGILALSVYVVLAVGQLSLGQAAFMGVGAYTGALLSVKFGVPFGVAMLASAVVPALLALVVGGPTLRLTGVYLAIATIGLGEITRIVFLNWDYAGGALGLSSIPERGGVVAIYGTLAVLLVGLTLVARSRVGRAMEAMREDEAAAGVMGVNLPRYRLVALVVSSAMAGVAGCLSAHVSSFIGPNEYGFEAAVTILSYALLGGIGSPLAPVLGSTILTLLPEVLRPLADFRLMVNGLIIVLAVLFMPRGILPWRIARTG
ncbi:amino acid ABC transporter [Methylobacterium indicum]|uniref:Amino acid ABC transporter n=1 Tax=Methylobacterium indicum TaxID=1775910 RepID=A0ABR5GP57_9HYPH|nr:branched-chain amino acid ABC transporter permease [Methylobacterium indicum]KMO10645.1 amino acid ABC transporter [Methylobacterium indicum]KMO16891.1 amino acid ABC transporter [Methylobacterium indicum]KTS38209.1 amino acid ABC transporter [Methylobacterium indicum]KTS39366.1 amino acid ABC transporter [Methylobacterium indicum]KTS47728.1 amino acid ABC transporter [Methylobacterium indicum]